MDINKSKWQYIPSDYILCTSCKRFVPRHGVTLVTYSGITDAPKMICKNCLYKSISEVRNYL